MAGRRGFQRLAQLTACSTLSVLLALCSASFASASGGVQIKDKKYGFSFDLPSGWKQVPLNGSDVSSLIETATKADPTLATALDTEVASATEHQIKLFAIGPLTDSFIPNVNVIVTSAAGLTKGDRFAAPALVQAKISLTQIGATRIKGSVQTNRLGRSADVTYRLPTSLAPNAFGDQIYAQHGSHVVIITVTTPELTTSEAVATAIGKSWRW